MNKDFLPYSNLWTTATSWFKNSVHWLNDPWETLDADACEKFVEESVKTMAQVTRFFKDKDIPAITKIGETVRSQLDEFRPKVPLMVALRKKGMKERHWDQVSNAIGFQLRPDESLTFTKVLDMGLMKHVDICCEIGERAAKEFQIETMLSTMMKQWDDINFTLNPYKGITFIVSGYDDIGAVLDEHLVNTQAM